MGSPISWGLTDEADATRGIFASQASGEILILSLDSGYEVLEPGFPEPGHEEWRAISLDPVALQVVTVDDSLVISGPATLILAPADGRWYVVDWYDNTRSPVSWGFLKARHLRTHSVDDEDLAPH